MPGFNPTDLRFTAHAEAVLKERKIPQEWVERVLAAPEWTNPDPRDPAAMRAYGAIPEAGGKILRVVYTTPGNGLRVVTAFFDRMAKRPAGSGT